ncbi:hypothetical protein [Maricaulis sp.]|nr:hypothetical protein [Maricaulis sp.]
MHEIQAIRVRIRFDVVGLYGLDTAAAIAAAAFTTTSAATGLCASLWG